MRKTMQANAGKYEHYNAVVWRLVQLGIKDGFSHLG